MADDAPTTDAPTTDAPAPGKTFTQDQVNDLIAREKGNLQRKYQDYDDLKKKASEFDKIAEGRKTDLERLTGERDQFKTQAEQAAADALRLRVAVKKGLVGERAALADRLRGSTEQELEADADELLKLAGAAATTSFDAGARGGGDTPQGMDAAIRRAMGR